MTAENWLESLLPIHGITFEMRFVEACTPGFFHQAALTAWLRRLLNSPQDYDLHMTIDVPEQGRRHYQAGDGYRFTVLGLDDTGVAWLRDLAVLLHQGVSGLKWDNPMPFRNNWRLERMLSWPEDRVITPGDPLFCVDMPVIAKQMAYLREQSVISLRMVAPWRLLRPRSEKAPLRGEMRFCRDNAHLQNSDSSLWLMRIGDALRDLVRRKGGHAPPRGETRPQEAIADVFWVDASYCDHDGNRKPMGGLMGRVSGIKPVHLSDEQLLLLVLGQFLGVGQRRAFGYGRYQLLDAAEKPLLPRKASVSLLERAMDAQNLQQAKSAVNDDGGDDVDEFSDMDESEADALAELSMKLLHGNYSPPPLNGFVHEDADGGLRPLAAPPVYDRILQRAVHQVLSPMLDGIMDQGSYGFRAGRSRFQVRDLIQSLYRKGFRWVFESDIRSFFDTVCWSRLEGRLLALLGDDPAVPVILQWMKQPVRWQGKRIARERGLPQGSPLSPVLANMLLDDFDHDLRDAGCRLIRFADDFVIVAKSRKDAEKGGMLARQALVDVGLELNPSKTRVVPFSDGFRFLGFMFVDGMAVESAPGKDEDAGKPPPASWLAKATGLPADDSQGEQMLRGEQAVHLAPYIDDKRMLIFCGEPAMVFTRAGSLCIERDDEALHHIPWSHLDAVILFGRHQITTPAIHEAMRQQVPVHMATGSGHYLGSVASSHAGMDMAAGWLVQQQRFSDKDWALSAAKSLMDARIRHMMENLRRREGLADSSWQARLESSLRQLSLASAPDALNGIEGAATRTYFSMLKQLVPSEFNFTARKRRPPPDPFNALLSLGYTLLYAHVDTVLRADGMLPVIGFYHRSHGSHSALASDLMEPFRHIVEREALRMLHGKRLKQEDFLTGEDGCRLTAAARRVYVGALSESMLRPVKARGESDAHSILEHIHHQNLALKFAIAGKTSGFQAWRIR